MLKSSSFDTVGDPLTLTRKLESIGYECLPYLAFQISLILGTVPDDKRIRTVLLEGPSGCGKSYLAKSLAKVAGAKLMVLSCYSGMETKNLIEYPSSFGIASAMTGRVDVENNPEILMNLGVISRAFLTSQTEPVILLVDEIDKPDNSIDTFFLGPIQDGTIWLDSRPPIEANNKNLIIIFTKNMARVLDDALLRRVHPIQMTYLDANLERKVLAPYCHPILVNNLVALADMMRYSDGSHQFDRPPAPEELITAGRYITQLLSWGMCDFSFVGSALWNVVAKSEHDRAVLEHLFRYHPEFMDPLFLDSKAIPKEEIHARLGRFLLKDMVKDNRAVERENAWKRVGN
jgi:hypothetical protein